MSRHSSTSKPPCGRCTPPPPTSTVHHRGRSGGAATPSGSGSPPRGTNTGPFFGPPSRRPVEITVIDIARIVDGRIVEHWGVPDRFALLAQTGVLDRLTAAA